jgi:hypothetical protein
MRRPARATASDPEAHQVGGGTAALAAMAAALETSAPRGGAAVALCLAHRQSAPSSSISQPSFADSGATAARSPRVAEIGVHRHARRGLETIRLAGPPEDRVGERAEPGPHYSGCGRIGAETLAAPLPANVARASTTDADRAPSRNFLRRVSGLAKCDRSENRGFSTQYVDCSRPERANNGGSKQRGGRSNRPEAVACGGAFGEGDCERSSDFHANCRIPQVLNDGDERSSQ